MTSADDETAFALTGTQVLSHIRFRFPGIDKSSALMLLYFTAGWLSAWHGRQVVDARFEAWQHGPTDSEAHAAFATTFPARYKPEETLRVLEVDAILDHHQTAHSSALITAANATAPVAEAAAGGEPAFASGPAIDPESMLNHFAEEVAAGSGPKRPGGEELEAFEKKQEAKRLQRQLAERFDTGPGISEA